ncbi:cytochrome B oxidoreductase [Insulibacter thermoxylanivorax]|uniref:Cytochrome B oxidoreductase n=1 Tax=Insulibacter thermoxylanivorax TaxID=2749268 RepID=A0A916QC37_9BACL|nr:cytochrome (ubi)quinol oxidase subunit III [Insulibacter thermoxylanivorax]GFR37997.1 cytochrome B oxidoreductase [Insulibacter thermoxylanivorax]
MSHVQTEDNRIESLERATLEGRNKILGFWVFLGAEVVIFGTLFAAHIALRSEVNYGVSGTEIFALPIVAIMTAILLTSSMTSVMAIQAMHRHDVKGTALWLTITVLLALGFLGLEIYEFYHYVDAYNFNIKASPFSTSFYVLVGCHGVHVAIGILWISLLIGQLFKKGLTVVTAPKIYLASLYWHFIDVVWVFIFTVVYLMGKVG